MKVFMLERFAGRCVLLRCRSERPKGAKNLLLYAARKKQILRSSTPATAKTAVAGDPGCAQDDTSGGHFGCGPPSQQLTSGNSGGPDLYGLFMNFTNFLCYEK